MEDITPISLRCPSDLAEKLAAQAAGHRRSRHAEILSILEAGSSGLGRVEMQAERPFMDAVKAIDTTISGTSDIPFRRSEPHDFTPQTKNARCGECGRLRHEH